LVSSDLIFNAKRDIEREKKARSWRGIRHSLGAQGERTENAYHRKDWKYCGSFQEESGSAPGRGVSARG